MSRAAALISAGRFALRQEKPALGVLAVYLNFKPVPEELKAQVPTLCVSAQGNVLYNEEFIESLPVDLIASAIAHEALHPALNIFTRAALLNPSLANIAHDYCVNAILVGSELRLGENWLYKEEWKSNSFEEIYQRLLKNNDAQLSLPMADMMVDDDIINAQFAQGSQNSNSPEALSELWRVRWRAAMKADRDEGNGRFAGTSPAYLTRAITLLEAPKLSFDVQIRKLLGSFGARSEESYRIANRRNSFQPFTRLMAGRRQSKPKGYVLLDTSGSMFDARGDALAGSALSYMRRLANDLGIEVECIMCDTQVAKTINTRELDDLIARKQLSAHGGGGSNFTPAFDLIWKEQKQLNGQSFIVCFTDGEINVPPSPQNKHPVFWVTNERQAPPTLSWGRHFVLSA